MKCPSCEKTVLPPSPKRPEEKEYFPFCSKRCKMIDLGAWLGERYRIPSSDASEEIALLDDENE